MCHWGRKVAISLLIVGAIIGFSDRSKAATLTPKPNHVQRHYREHYRRHHYLTVRDYILLGAAQRYTQRHTRWAIHIAARLLRQDDIAHEAHVIKRITAIGPDRLLPNWKSNVEKWVQLGVEEGNYPKLEAKAKKWGREGAADWMQDHPLPDSEVVAPPKEGWTLGSVDFVTVTATLLILFVGWFFYKIMGPSPQLRQSKPQKAASDLPVLRRNSAIRSFYENVPDSPRLSSRGMNGFDESDIHN